MSRKVVVDTSTLVSAAIRPDSIPDLAVNHALQFDQVYISDETFAELERVLHQAKFDRYISAGSREIFLQKMRRDAIPCVLQDSHLMGVSGDCRDRTDERFLALALAVDADLIVSSDNDLLTLHPWRGIPILTPAQFLDQS